MKAETWNMGTIRCKCTMLGANYVLHFNVASSNGEGDDAVGSNCRTFEGRMLMVKKCSLATVL